MKILATDFILYEVNDFARAISFYQDKLGLKLSSSHEPFWAEFEAPPTTLALFCPVDMLKRPAKTGGAAIALAVPDVEAALIEARAKRLTVVMDFIDTPVCHMAALQDPDGNVVYLHHRKDGTVG